MTQTAAEFAPATDELLYERRGAVAYLTFNRPQARNAMTWAMYEGLYAACDHVEHDDRVRVLVLRGAGERAFVSGTDISQFQSFKGPEDVHAYERNNSRWIGRLESLNKPTVAMLRGYATGAGAVFAAVCDLRIAASDVQFGFPIARTLGNVLSNSNFNRLVQLIGPARVKELVFTARLATAEEGLAMGLFTQVVPPEQLQQRVDEMADRIASNAPLTIRATKEAVRRIVAATEQPETNDLIELCYLSEDFREGVSAFLEKRRPNWQGR